MAGTFVKDLFAGTANTDLASHIRTDGGSWVLVAGAIGTQELDGDGLIRAVTGFSTYKSNNVAGAADVIAVYEFTIIIGGTTGEITGLCLRCNDGTSGTGYKFLYDNGGSGFYIWNPSGVINANGYAKPIGVDLLVRVSAIGTALNLDVSTDSGVTYSNIVNATDSGQTLAGNVLTSFNAPGIPTAGYRIGPLQASLVATNYTAILTGSSTILPSTPSGNITLALNGALRIDSGSPVIWTPSDGSSGGSFSGGTLETYAIDGTAITTYENATPGTYSITFTNNSGLTNPSSISITVSSGPSLGASPSSGATGGGNVTFTVTGSGTSMSGGSPLTISASSGLTGDSIVSQSLTGQVVTIVVNVGTTAGTLTFTDTADSVTCNATITLGLPGIPTSPVCSPGNTQNVLTWVAPSSGGRVATYNVYRGTTPGGESGTPIATGITTLTYTDTGLTNGQIYYYNIKAVNATGTGSSSSEVSGTPQSTATSYTAIATPTVVAPSGTVTAPVTPNGNFTGTITGTPSGSAAVGLSPVVKTFSNSSSPQNATWTPTVVGTLTITWTNSGSLSNQSPETITVSNVVTYYTTATNVTGTPTFAVYNAGTTTLASSVTAASPVQIGSTLTWTASFTAPIGDYDVSWDNNGTYSPAFAEGQITGSGTFTYFAHIGNASGTPTLAIYNAGTGTSATVTLTGPAQISTTGVWVASFTSNPGNYVPVWDQSGTYTATSAHLTYADQSSGGGGGGGSGAGVLASPAPTSTSFCIMEPPVVPGLQARAVEKATFGVIYSPISWQTGRNVGWSGVVLSQSASSGGVLTVQVTPAMTYIPATGDLPVFG